MNGHNGLSGSIESRGHENRLYSWNLLCLCVVEAGWGLGGAFLSGGAVLPLLAASLGASLGTVGLLPGLAAIASALPQLLAAHRTSGLTRRLPPVARGHVWPTLAFLPVAAVAWHGGSGNLQVVLLYLALACWYVGLGYVVPVWLAFVGSLAGPARRGHALGVTSMVGLVGGVAGSWLCGRLLEAWPAPGGYAACALAAFTWMNLANVGWLGIEEPALTGAAEEEPAGERPSLRAYLAGLASSVRGNSEFLRLLVAQQLVSLHSALGSFYLLYAQRQFGASPARVMVLASTSMAAQAVGSVVYASVADRIGVMPAVIGSQALLLAAMAAALAATAVDHLTAVAVLLGLFYGTYFNARTTAVMELARGSDSAAYQAVSNLFTTPASVAVPALAGWAAERYGYHAVLCAALAGTAGGTALLILGYAPGLLARLRSTMSTVERQVRLAATLW
ncbi:MAG: MFS transporter [Candidatus Wallbacteria bacterium]|nr:MFS transporter [Candidatus Wallbacteria bacterium]